MKAIYSVLVGAVIVTMGFAVGYPTCERAPSFLRSWCDQLPARASPLIGDLLSDTGGQGGGTYSAASPDEQLSRKPDDNTRSKLDDVLAAPPRPLPRSTRRLTLPSLMSLIESSSSCKDYLGRIQLRYQPDSIHNPVSLLSDLTFTSRAPYVSMVVGDATIVYAMQLCADIAWKVPGETIHFQVVEKPNGDLAIGTSTFNGSTSAAAASSGTLSPQAVRAMHGEGAQKGSNRFMTRECRRCHRKVSSSTSIDDEDSPRIDGLEGGSLRGTGARSRLSLRRLSDTKAKELLRKLRQNDSWPRLRSAFEAAVRDESNVDALLQRRELLGNVRLADKRATVEKLLARRDLAAARQRNRQSIAWNLADGVNGKLSEVQKRAFSLLSRSAIESIGPRILEMLVDDAVWSRLSEDEQSEKVRVAELDVRSLDELRHLVRSHKVAVRTRRRVNTFIVLEKLLGDENEVLEYLAVDDPAPGSQNGQDSIALLDAYARALRRRPAKESSPDEAAADTP